MRDTGNSCIINVCADCFAEWQGDVVAARKRIARRDGWAFGRRDEAQAWAWPPHSILRPRRPTDRPMLLMVMGLLHGGDAACGRCLCLVRCVKKQRGAAI